MQKKERDKDSFADFFYNRFRPEAKQATDTWLATNNPRSTPHPFIVEEYSLEPEREAKRLSDGLHKGSEMQNRRTRILIVTL